MRVRRPFAAAGFAAMGALLAAPRVGFGVSAALAVLCAVCAAALLFGLPAFRRRGTAATVMCAASLALCWYCFAQELWVAPAAALAGKTAEISGVIADEPQQSYGSYSYPVKADSITVNGKKTGVRTALRLKTTAPLAARPFDRVTASVALALPPAQNAAGYSSRAYYKSKGVYLVATAQNVAVSPAKSRPPYYWAIRLREWIGGALQRSVGGSEGALAAGILIGDTSGLPAQASADFTVTGISHILAVSGTQTSLIMEYLLLLFGVLRLGRRLSAVLAMGAVAAFMAVTGFSPSVMRAGLMALLCLSAILVRREADTVNSLGFSVLALCAANPFAATDVGLLLSAFATLGMAVVTPRLLPLVRRLADGLPRAGKLLRAPGALLCETLGASLFTYPVIVLAFGQVSLVALAANLVEVPVSLFVTLAAAVLAALSAAPVLALIAQPLALLVRLCCAFMLWAARALASLPFAAVSAQAGYVNLFVFFAALLAAFAVAAHVRGGLRLRTALPAAAACLCFLLAAGSLSYAVASHGVVTVETLAGGGAVVAAAGRAFVVGLPPTLAGATQAEEVLSRRGIRTVEAAVLLTGDAREARALAVLQGEVDVRRAYMPPKAGTKTDTGFSPPQAVTAPSRIALPGGAQLLLLPDKSGKYLLGLLQCGASRAALCSGGDYSAYSPAALKASLLVCGAGTAGVAAEISPAYAAGEPGTQALAQCVAAGAAAYGSPAVFLTRGAGFSVQ